MLYDLRIMDFLPSSSLLAVEYYEVPSTARSDSGEEERFTIQYWAASEERLVL